MARIVPTDWRTLEATGAAARERETLAMLETALPDELTVYHGVHWTRVDRGTAAFGEIDFVVVAPSARIVLVEQKSGFLSETPDGLVKKYSGKDKLVAVQLDRTLEALRARLAPLVQGEPLAIEYLLYCPDYTVRQPGTAGLPPERIVDGRSRARLAARIVEAAGADPPRDVLAHRLRRFFDNELQLVPDVSALVGRAEQLVTRLSGGLATWARRLDFDPFRLRVVGTAGSGKTQLALAVLNDAAAQGRRALYVCFNRPLADHLAQVAPEGADVASFHQLCDRSLRAAGEPIDYRRADAFERLERQFAALPAARQECFDEIVIDEGQDFQPAWKDALLRRLRPGGRLWWLEDPLQRLYDRPPVPLPGFVTLRADANYRSPRDVLGFVNRLLALDPPVQAAGPIAGGDVEFLTYADAQSLLAATKRAVTRVLQSGLRIADTVLVTFSGRERSALRSYDRIGPHRLKSWQGRYDLFGRPEYSEGELLVETVYRFKGQSAPCVILTEVDFEAFDELPRRKLFVGMTRASMKLVVVLSDRAARQLLAQTDQPGAARPSPPAGEWPGERGRPFTTP